MLIHILKYKIYYFDAVQTLHIQDLIIINIQLMVVIIKIILFILNCHFENIVNTIVFKNYGYLLKMLILVDAQRQVILTNVQIKYFDKILRMLVLWIQLVTIKYLLLLVAKY